MVKSIFRILFFIILSIAGCFGMYSLYNFYVFGDYAKIDELNANIIIQNDKVLVQQDYLVPNLNSRQYIFQSIIDFEKDYGDDFVYTSIEKDKINYMKDYKSFWLDEIEKNNDHFFISFEAPIEKIIKNDDKYSVIDLANLNTINCKKCNINIYFQDGTSYFSAGDFKEYQGSEKQSEFHFSSESKKFLRNNNSLQVFFDKIENENIPKNTLLEEYKYQVIKKYVLNQYTIVFGIISIVLLVITLFIRWKDGYLSKPKEYIRDSKGIMKPIYIESVVDGKIGAKELIMTCIVSLINKEKISVKNDNEIVIESIEDLSPTEYAILEMLFETRREKLVGKSLNFKDLGKIFKSNNDKTVEIYNKFLVIKEIILDKLYRNNIFDKNKDIVLKVIRCLCFVNVITNIIMIVNIMGDLFINVIVNSLLGWPVTNMNYIIIIDIILFVRFFFLRKTVSSMIKEKRNNSIFGSVYTISYTVCLILIGGLSESNANLLVSSWYLFLINIVLILLNAFTYRFTIQHALTKQGREELLKAKALKNYIIDYSLMEKRDMEEVVLWDEFLVYATAFGIPNKITKRLGEGLMNVNIVLQLIV